MTLRFEGKSGRAPRDYLSRGQQVRLLAMVAALGAVVLVMGQLSGPHGGAALERMLRGDTAAALKPGAAASEANPKNNPPWISEDLLATIRDNTHFRDAESAAWFAIIENLQPAAERLDPHDGPPLSYAQLLEQPDVYRARAVTVAGAIRRVERVSPAPNDLGLNHYFRIIIQPAGREVWPILVYSLERPEGVPLGDSVDRTMSARGVFFKNLSYRSPSGMGVAPVVLAQSVQVAPRPPSPASHAPTSATTVAQGVMTAAAIAAALVLFLWLRRPGQLRAARGAPTDLNFDRLAREASGPSDQA